MKYPRKTKLECPKCGGKGYMIIRSMDFLTNYTLRYAELRNKIRKIGRKNIQKMSLRQIAKEVGMFPPSAQRIKHHLLQVEKYGWNKEEKE